MLVPARSIVLGVCDAVEAVGNPHRTRRTLRKTPRSTPNRVMQRAEELLMRLCSLGEIASIKVRAVLVRVEEGRCCAWEMGL